MLSFALALACYDTPAQTTVTMERPDAPDEEEPLVYVSGLELQSTGEPGGSTPPEIPENPFEGEEYLSVYQGDTELCRISWEARAEWDPITEGGPTLQFDNACWEPAIRGDVGLCERSFGRPEPMVNWPLGVEPRGDGSAEMLTFEGQWYTLGEGWYDGEALGYVHEF